MVGFDQEAVDGGWCHDSGGIMVVELYSGAYVDNWERGGRITMRVGSRQEMENVRR